MSGERDREPWNPRKELERDQRFERGLLWKELGVLALLAALVLLRVAFAR